MGLKILTLVMLYGNFTTMGVVAELPKGMSADDVSEVKAYLVSGETRKPVHNLARVGGTDLFAGSLFWLEPGTEYTVEVEFCDRSGKLVAKERAKGRTRSDPVIPDTPKSLYVSPSGSDENPGSIDKPLKTLNAAFAKLTPGTTLFVREGIYYEGALIPPKAAAGEGPIVIRNYNGERVTIDGAAPDLIDAKWSTADGRIYTTPFAGKTWNVTAQDKKTGKYYRLFPLETKSEIDTGKSDGKTFKQLGFTGAYHCDGKNIHIVTPGGDISNYKVFVSRFTEAVTLSDRGHITFDGLEFGHFGRGDWGTAILMEDSSENLVQNCRFFYCNTGVWVQWTSSNNTVQDCLFVDDLAHWHFTYAKNPAGYNYHEQIETGAVYTGGRYTGRGLVVRRNRMEGLFDGAHLGPWVEVNSRTSETDFSYNTVIDVADDFVETDGYSRNVRIIGNVMDRSLSGISLAQALDGPTFILYNVNANCGVCAATTNPSDYHYEGYPVKTNGGPHPDIGSGPVFFYHNTSYTTDPDSRAFLVKGAKWRIFVLRNNIWCGKAAGFVCWRRSLSLMDWDWDDLYHEAGAFMDIGRGTSTYNTIRDAQTNLDVLKHGISADPKFVDADGGNYHLRPTSPCIDAGVVVPGINDTRYNGKAPDIGALEAK